MSVPDSVILIAPPHAVRGDWPGVDIRRGKAGKKSAANRPLLQIRPTNRELVLVPGRR
jgi:hypothetical protein